MFRHIDFFLVGCVVASLLCVGALGLVPIKVAPMHQTTFGTSPLLPENNVTRVFRNLLNAVMDRSKEQLAEIFADDATGYTVGPAYYPFPNKTALVDMLYSCSWLDPVYAFYVQGVPTFKNTGMYVGNAPYISETNEAGIPTDFLYIEVDEATQTQITFYLEMVPLFPLANQTTSVSAATAMLDAFAGGNLQYLDSVLNDEDFTMKIGVYGEEEYLSFPNKTTYIQTVKKDLMYRKAFIYKMSTTSAAVNMALVQYTWIRTVPATGGRTPNEAASRGLMGRDTLRISFVGDGDYTITRIDGFRRIDKAL